MKKLIMVPIFTLLCSGTIFANPGDVKFYTTQEFITSSDEPADYSTWRDGYAGTTGILHWGSSTVNWVYNVDNSDETATLSKNALDSAFSRWSNTEYVNISFVCNGEDTTPEKSADGVNTLFLTVAASCQVEQQLQHFTLRYIPTQQSSMTLI